MKRLVKFLFWGTVFVALLLVIDQFFVRVPVDIPGVTEVRHFYLDFRHRLFGTVAEHGPDAIGSAIEQAESPPPPARAVTPRWVYADEAGNLQFADHLEEVPARYRAEAQPLDE